jgi:uncharacterized protein (TIGR03435 family)
VFDPQTGANTLLLCYLIYRIANDQIGSRVSYSACLRHLTFKGWLLALMPVAAFAYLPPQSSQPSFDAVSIRAADAYRTVHIGATVARLHAGWKPCSFTRDRVTCRLPLWALVREAFQLREFQLSAPDWTKNDMFEVQAVMPVDTPQPIARLMLQTALIEQFNLQYHLALRETPVYALVPTRTGPQLTDFDPKHSPTHTRDTPEGTVTDTFVTAPGRYFEVGVTLDIFAQNLRSIADLDRPVINDTGFIGKYVIDMKWKSSTVPDEMGTMVDKGILQAIERELGLRLEKKNVSLEYLSVDHVNRAPQF